MLKCIYSETITFNVKGNIRFYSSGGAAQVLFDFLSVFAESNY